LFTYKLKFFKLPPGAFTVKAKQEAGQPLSPAGLNNPPYPYLRKGDKHFNSVNAWLSQDLQQLRSLRQQWPLEINLKMLPYPIGYLGEAKPSRWAPRGPLLQSIYLPWTI